MKKLEEYVLKQEGITLFLGGIRNYLLLVYIAFYQPV